jgi:predicted nucleic acid-binding protein
MPENNPHFLDTNIWLYAILKKGSTEKIEYAQSLIDLQPAVLSTQVLTEVCSELLNKGKEAEANVQNFVETAYSQHRVVELDKHAYLTAVDLRKDYGLSFRDSLIAAAAFTGGARIIYSDKLKHGTVFREMLSVIDPLKHK